jgi:hypothetical protein
LVEGGGVEGCAVASVPVVSSERFEMRVPAELMVRVDAARGFESRASFVKRALEAALDVAPEPYALEAERQAVRAAVAAGAEGVRVEAGSVVPEPKPIPGVRRGSSVESDADAKARAEFQRARDAKQAAMNKAKGL